MKKAIWILFIVFCLISTALISPKSTIGQQRPPQKQNPALKTPLSQDILTLLANELSGQIIFNNEVTLAGAPWIRDKKEFTGTFYESQRIYDIARSYGIETVKLIRYPRDRTFDYPIQGEFWLVEPEKRLIARLEADVALIASSSANVDITGILTYIPPLSGKEAKKWIEAGPQEKYKNKIALMWSHASRNVAKALDAAGIKGVVSFSSRERYFDPDQVVYGRGSYSGMENLKFGFTVSWRQWSELLEDVEGGKKLTVRCKTKINKHQDRFESVFCWIPGSEPDKKGVIFVGHLFEGYTKRGANDNMSGCAVQLEIFRALSKLIAQKALPQPRRTIYFLWPNEISGTYEYIKQNPAIVDKLSATINMDMVGEALRKNNAIFTFTECTNHLPSYLDALGDSIMNYVWRTNDIVYLRDSPRGRRGGQYFPRPMWEKNGSRDAFRYYTHTPTGGSDHICFNNPSVAVPAVELNIWPDQWYHADTDTPDKSDPTQLRRTAFIGAAMAWAAANCTDEVLEDLAKRVSDFGFFRIGKRELPRALGFIDQAKADTLQTQTNLALYMILLAVQREMGALQTLQDIYTGSETAKKTVHSQAAKWKLYLEKLEDVILDYSHIKADQLKATPPQKTELTKQQEVYTKARPSLHPDVKARQFRLESSEAYKNYMKENPDALKGLGLNFSQRRAILNFVNGEHSITDIHKLAMGETARTMDFDKLIRYLEFLKTVSWITY